LRKTLIAFAASLSFVTAAHAQTPNTLLNVSYDIARELYAAVNVEFAKQWKAKTGQDVTINQSHNGSTRQARAILEGLEADVVTFNQVPDVQVLADVAASVGLGRDRAAGSDPPPQSSARAKSTPFASGPNQVTIASTTATTPQTMARARP